MKPTTAAALALLISTVAAAPADCAWRDIAATDFSMSPPPSPGSLENDKDFSALLQYQAERSEADCALARTQKSPDFHSLYDSSGLLSKTQLAAVGPFLVEASNFAASISGYFKKKFGRPRPYNEDPRIEPCADKPSGATAYPSTHATVAALDACVLGRLFPAEAQPLAEYGKHLGDLRAIVGVHHPSDVAAGQDLAGQLCSRLLGESDFQAELEKVRGALAPPAK